ncbi:hypothetical protein FHS55_002636 [Angulomicrobium tetraedrale]|uniref:Uncharacterized protein n=1 Tax=Ancylobacter tetraedralis TaxID=217068 RepID=A0A839ZBC6_9HYPH|nr:hypothetical protein [Ancylobacter tetraedralis]MBB3772027.1 hypothetical protein [Ancylobacter tetraedralis]
MTYTIVNPSLGAPSITDIANTANDYYRPWKLGARVRAVDETYGEGEFIYLKGVANTVRGSVVVFNPDDWSTVLAVANAVGPIAVAMGATVASTYGWYQIFGKGVASVLTGFVDNADCYLTATDGSIDDTDVAGDYIRGMKGASAIGTPAAGLAEVELWYPQVADGKDN